MLQIFHPPTLHSNKLRIPITPGNPPLSLTHPYAESSITGPWTRPRRHFMSLGTQLYQPVFHCSHEETGKSQRVLFTEPILLPELRRGVVYIYLIAVTRPPTRDRCCHWRGAKDTLPISTSGDARPAYIGMR